MDTLESSVIMKVHFDTYCRSSGYLAPCRDSAFMVRDSSTRRAAFLLGDGQSRENIWRRLRAFSHASHESAGCCLLCTYRRGQQARTRGAVLAETAPPGPYFIFGRVPDGDASLESGSLGSLSTEGCVHIRPSPTWLFYRLSSITGGGRFVCDGSRREVETDHRIGKRHERKSAGEVLVSRGKTRPIKFLRLGRESTRRRRPLLRKAVRAELAPGYIVQELRAAEAPRPSNTSPPPRPCVDTWIIGSVCPASRGIGSGEANRGRHNPPAGFALRRSDTVCRSTRRDEGSSRGNNPSSAEEQLGRWQKPVGGAQPTSGQTVPLPRVPGRLTPPAR